MLAGAKEEFPGFLKTCGKIVEKSGKVTDDNFDEFLEDISDLGELLEFSPEETSLMLAESILNIVANN